MKYKDDMSEQLRGNTTMLILGVLSKYPSHGYGIAERIEKDSGGKIKLGATTIYPVLKALEQEGLIVSKWVTPQTTGVPRKDFMLTPAGHEALNIKRTFFFDVVVDVFRKLTGDTEECTSNVTDPGEG